MHLKSSRLITPSLRALAPALLLLSGCLDSGTPFVAADAGHRDSGGFDAGSSSQCAFGLLTCGNNATCVDDPENGSACFCNVGYAGDGRTCVDVDECDTDAGGANSCDLNAACQNLTGTYKCTCNPGYSGDGHHCTLSPVGLCATNNGGCDSHATCASEGSNVTCTCKPGYTGDGATCSVQSACTAGTAHCDSHATCSDLPQGGAVCTCNAGYQGNGFECTDINECNAGLSNCGTNAVCSNTPGSFTCACRMGFQGNGFDCEDVDECVNGSATCAANARCTNTMGSYSCSCPDGYQGDGHTCVALDPCALNLAHCGSNAYCQATTGGAYRCLCQEGYEGDGYTCRDIDECLTGSAHCATNATCTNLAGGFRCACNLGYSGDGRTSCTAENQCTNGTANCSADATCTPAIGSFTCTCNSGFEGTGVVCTDIDECIRGTNACDPNAVCTNTRSSYTCACSSGFTGDGRSCQNINECANGSAICGGTAPCVDTPGDYYCRCLAGNEGGASCHPLRKHLALSDTSGCTISQTTGGNLSCWGTNLNGALGLGATVLESKSAMAVSSPAPNLWNVVGTSTTHSCGIRTDGTLWCWGRPDASNTLAATPTKVGTATNWVDVAAGRNFTCGVRGDGTLWCWGLNDLGQLADGTLANTTTPHQVGAGTDWMDVTAGDHHACAIRSGALYCWGGNEYGQLGIGVTPAAASVPTATAIPRHWGSVRATRYGTCGVSDSGALYCWGDNTYGQLGTGDFVPTNVPVQITATDPAGAAVVWTSVGPGPTHTCGLDTLGRSWCWGDNSVGALGNSNLNSTTRPIRVNLFQDWTEIVAGDSFTCARHNNNTTACWGSNDGARLGNGKDASVTSLTEGPVDGGKAWLQFSAGTKSACGITQANALFCWGDNSSGQLGNTTTGSPVSTQTPVAAKPDVANVVWQSIAVGSTHACGTDQAGRLFCWGDNAFGQLGVPTTTTRQLVPTQVSPDLNWVGVAAGAFHTCGLRNNGTGGKDLYCWGRNDSGQLGIGTRVNAGISIVAEGTEWASVSAGDAHTCARDAAGGLACWGANTFGQLGDGSTNLSVWPARIIVSGVSSWSSVFLGTGMSCAITGGDNGDMYCWGLNNYGQLGVSRAGTNDNSNKKVPTLVVDGLADDNEAHVVFNWNRGSDSPTAVAGESHVCAIDSGNALWCWGRNVKGEFADGKPLTNPSTMALNPKASGSGTWTALSAGRQFTCAAQSTTLYCSGLNDHGQLGDNLAWKTDGVLQP